VIYIAGSVVPNPLASPPVHVLSGSNKTHVEISWEEATAATGKLPILGYRLKMDYRGNGDYQVVYDGDGMPNVLSYTHGPLLTGETYNFVVEVLNFNGASDPSDPVEVTVCVAPTGFTSLKFYSLVNTESTVGADTIVTSTVKVAWQPPKDRGG